MLAYRARWHLARYYFHHGRLSWRRALKRWVVAATIVALLLVPEVR